MDQGAMPMGIDQQAFDAGPDQVLVVYQPPDLSAELDPISIFGAIAADAARRAGDGLRIVSMTSMPLRHAGAFFGQEGSGLETKVAVAVVYERSRGVPAT
jgi:hypothetical protein